MPRRILAGLVALVLVALTALPAGAVPYGEPDGNAHPYVGLVVFFDAAGNPTHRCTGALLSATVFLTAGHCTEDAASARVYFEPDLTNDPGYPRTGGVTGEPITHPDFIFQVPETNDIGVVLLDEPVELREYGVLPELGVLNDLATQRGKRNVTFTVVGYGLQGVKPRLSAERIRMSGTVRLVNLRSALTDGFNIQTTNAPGTGGGTCFGDSGGPVFLNRTNVIVGVNSFVLNQNCKGASFAFRTDIKTSLDFVNKYL